MKCTVINESWGPLIFDPSSSTVPTKKNKIPTLISSSSMARFPRGATAMALCRTCQLLLLLLMKFLIRNCCSKRPQFCPFVDFLRKWTCGTPSIMEQNFGVILIYFDYSPNSRNLARGQLECAFCSLVLMAFITIVEPAPTANSNLLLRLTEYTRIAISGGSITK